MHLQREELPHRVPSLPGRAQTACFRKRPHQGVQQKQTWSSFQAREKEGNPRPTQKPKPKQTDPEAAERFGGAFGSTPRSKPGLGINPLKNPAGLARRCTRLCCTRLCCTRLCQQRAAGGGGGQELLPPPPSRGVTPASAGCGEGPPAHAGAHTPPAGHSPACSPLCSARIFCCCCSIRLVRAFTCFKVSSRTTAFSR